MPVVTPADFKRQIMEESDKSPIREKIINASKGKNEDEMVEIGEELQRTTQTKGWLYITEYISRRSLMVYNSVLEGKNDPMMVGEAKGLRDMSHFIDQSIKFKDEILKRREDGLAEG